MVDLGGLSDGAPLADAGARGGEAGRDAGTIPAVDADAGDASSAKDAPALPDGAVVFGGTGHAYWLVSQGGPIPWSDARAASLAAGGHLATASSSAEQAFLVSLLSRSGAGEVWLGGVQTSGANEPDGGWGWDDGEPFTFGAWGPGEPNDYGDGEACMGLRADGWNDEGCANASVTGYIVERD